jgi:methyl-accepting chemotaxis protein
MQRNQTARGLLAKDWKEVIEKVQEVFAQTGSEAAERARNLDSAPASSQSEQKVAAWKEGLEQYEERIQGFQACLHRAEQNMEESEASLLEAEDGINEWIEAIGVMRKKWQEQEGVARKC